MSEQETMSEGEAAEAPSESYMTHYRTLQKTVKEMREMSEPDVDKLIPLVQAGTEAYQGCKARIEQVEQALSRLGIEQQQGAAEPS